MNFNFMRTAMNRLILISLLFISCQGSTSAYRTDIDHSRDSDSKLLMASEGTSAAPIEARKRLGPIDSIVSKMLFPGRDTKQDFYKCENQRVYKYDIVDSSYEGVAVRYYERDNGGDDAILFFHGNGSTACGSIDLANYLTGVFNKSIIVAEYPGYSNDSQISSEASLTESSLAMYREVKDKYSNVDIFAHSLGTGIASFIASVEDVNNIVLYAPFDNILNVAKTKFPGLLHPLVSRALKKNMFSSDEWLKNTEARVFIAHGQKDEMIPIELAKNLFSQVAGEDKVFIELENVDHNTIVFDKDLNNEINKIH